MFHRYLMALCALSLVLPDVAANATVTYTFTQLAPAGSDAQAYPLAMSLVNGAPQPAGVTGGGTTNLNQGYPCIWGSAGGAGTDVLGDLPPGDRGKVFAIDSAGDVVGNLRTSPPVSGDSLGTQSAFFLGSGSTSGTLLPLLTSGDLITIPHGVENSSTVVGIEGAAAPVTSGVIWTKAGSTWSAAALPGLGWTGATTADSYCGAYAISSTGIIAGSALAATSGMMTAVEWTNSGSGWVANDLITHTETQNYSGWAKATAVNDSGVAVGESTYVSSPNSPDIAVHAVIFQNGNPVTLGSFGDVANNDCANGINDSGVVVGESSNTAGNPLAFIWDSVNGFRNMNTVYGSAGYNVIPSGWTLDDAVSIDNNGDIAGTAETSAGTYVGFVIRARLPGDANGDGRVDINDLTIVLANFGRSTGMGWSTGDFTGGGTVDLNDLTIVLANFGTTYGSAGLAAVPEPSSFLLFGLAAVSLAACVYACGTRGQFMFPPFPSVPFRGRNLADAKR